MLGQVAYSLHVLTWVVLWSTARTEGCDDVADRAMRYAGLGYNLLKADPDAAMAGGVDPGYLPSRRVIYLDSDPSAQVTTVTRDACQTRSSASLVYDDESFQGMWDMDVSIGDGVPRALQESRFGLSSTFSQVKVTTKTRLVQQWESICSCGGARIRLDSDTIRVSRDFQEAVCSLPVEFEEEAYISFLNSWGTNVVMGVDVGMREVAMRSQKMAHVFERMFDTLSQEPSAEGKINAIFATQDGLLEMNMAALQASAAFNETFGDVEEARKSGGSLTRPQPVSVLLHGIQTLVEAKYFRNFTAHACSEATVAQLPEIQRNLRQALEIYPGLQGVQVERGSGKVSFPLTWPRGTYGTMSSDTDCPGGGITWLDGSRLWDCEDRNPGTFITTSEGTTYGEDMKVEFCIKAVPHASLDYDTHWPRGEYCLLKYGDCPDGFELGKVHWDDEDSRNGNRYTGTMPNGEYGRDTTMEFCCRVDGSPNVPIFLPTEKTFLLLVATRQGCQKVQGMHFSEYIVRWDTEDNNNHDWRNGTAPWDFESEMDIMLMMCVYERD